MIRSDWFIDTFPSIVGLSTDGELVEEAGAQDFEQDLVSDPGDSSKVPGHKLLRLECEGNEILETLCERCCTVNKCRYTSGTVIMVTPLVGIFTIENPRLAAHLTAIHNFRAKFCALQPQTAGKHFTMFKKLSPAAVENQKFDAATAYLMLAIIRFHRPGIAAILQSVFGDSSVPAEILLWLSTGLVSACPSGDIARELVASIAATGDPATVPLLIVGTLDEIIASIPEISPESVGLAISEFSLSPHSLTRIWQSATVMARYTPKSFSADYSLCATHAGRSKIWNSPKFFPSFGNDSPVPMLTMAPRVLVEELLKAAHTPTEEETVTGNESLAFSIGEEPMSSTKRTTGNMCMDCIAGEAIKNGLKLFNIQSTPPSPDRADRELSAKTWTCIDARTESERDQDDTIVVEVGSTGVSRENSRPHSEVGDGDDWFNGGAPDDLPVGSEAVSHRDEDKVTGPPNRPSVVVRERHVIHRLKTCLWLDADVDLATLGDATSPAALILKKLEFYRGTRLCIVGSGEVASLLALTLLHREFPYITVVTGGFEGLRTALVQSENAACTVRLLSIVGSEQSASAKRDKLKTRKSRSSMSASLQAFGQMFHSIDTKDIKSKFVSFKSSVSSAWAVSGGPAKSPTPKPSRQPTPPPIVVVPSPEKVEPSGFLASLRKKTPSPDAKFEIGGEDEEEVNVSPSSDKFSSIDLSPVSR